MQRSTAGENDQSHFRRLGTVYDQHISERFPKGRPWRGFICKKSGIPLSQLRPQGWSSPWEPPQGPEYFKFSEDDPTRFTIDYTTMLQERIKAHEAYDAQYRSEALKRGWNPEDEEKKDALGQIVGAKPLPIEPVKAAMQGNRFILGLTDRVDERVLPFLRKREDRKSLVLDSLPDFSDEDNNEDDEFDDLMDLEEKHDPDAIGGKTMTPGELRAARMREAKAAKQAAKKAAMVAA